MSHINEASIAVEVRAVVKVFGAALRTKCRAPLRQDLDQSSQVTEDN
jgi:hypothetical protein